MPPPIKRCRAGAVAFALAPVLGAWMALSPVHQYQDADSIVPVLVSLWRWTFFYWEQNRFGMLIPLLAVPVSDPFVNLLLQMALRFTAIVFAFFLVARLAVPRPCWPAVGAAGLALLLAAADLPFHAFLQMQPYPLAIALAAGGILLIEHPGRGRRLVGAALVACAAWVTFTIVFWALPLLLLRWMLWREESVRAQGRLWPAALALACAAAASLGFSRFYVYAGTELAPTAPALWPAGWAALSRNIVELFGPLPIAVLVATAAAVAVGTALGSAPAKRALAAVLCLAGIALGELIVLGASGWVHLNHYPLRFQLAGMLGIALALPALVLVLVLEGRPRWARTVNVLALVLLLPLTAWRFGLPSPGAARQGFDRWAGIHSDALLRAGATHVLGDYWQVWPAVLHANLRLREAGVDRRLWGISIRAEPTAAGWRPADWSAARIAVLGDDATVEAIRQRYRVPPLRQVGLIGGVRIVVAGGAVEPSRR
ncbi:MAG TPA: hypothetical protein VH394_29840 [Thermoanaerobaculia bacterium]|nr:hypothetical protein [Thermoanaerobaculia bacterium]